MFLRYTSQLGAVQAAALHRQLFPLKDGEKHLIELLDQSKEAEEAVKLAKKTVFDPALESVTTFCQKREQESSEIANRISIFDGNMCVTFVYQNETKNQYLFFVFSVLTAKL